MGRYPFRGDKRRPRPVGGFMSRAEPINYSDTEPCAICGVRPATAELEAVTYGSVTRKRPTGRFLCERHKTTEDTK